MASTKYRLIRCSRSACEPRQEMITRPGKSEAEVEAEARCYEAEARDVA